MYPFRMMVGKVSQFFVGLASRLSKVSPDQGRIFASSFVFQAFSPLSLSYAIIFCTPA